MNMTAEEMEARIYECEKNSALALEIAKKAQELAVDNKTEITKVDARARSCEHRVSKLEGKIDTLLDKVSAQGVLQRHLANAQDEDAKNGERVRKNTVKVLASIIALVVINLTNYFF